MKCMRSATSRHAFSPPKMLLTKAVENKEMETISASRITMLSALHNKESKIVVADAELYPF